MDQKKKYYNRYQGFNSRMDELQAAFLSLKLKYLDIENERRRVNAETYSILLQNAELILPQQAGEEHIWHQYIVRSSKRNQLQNWLQKQGVDTQIHYPLPPHLQECYPEYNHLSFPLTERLSQEILSLPISSYMGKEELTIIAEAINSFAE